MPAKAHTVSGADEFQPPGFPLQGQWTYEDYLRLPDDGRRYEVLQGVLYEVEVPSPLHQIVLRNVVRLLALFLERGPLGEFFLSPTDLILPRGLTAPIQPDLFFVLGEDWKGTVTSQYMEGSPDLVLEVLSPSTRRYDRQTKLSVYA